MLHWFKDDPGSRPPQPSKRGSHAALLDMISHPHAVEVLDTLAQGPATLTAMSAQLRGGRRGLERALRALAAGGLVTGCQGGTWDGALRRDEFYRLTERGGQVVRELSRWPVWEAMLDTEPDALGDAVD
jgi:DNA-binding transcriptional ArsR family regulator